ncbi:unnamed protein product [Moneuplotes crassus]|uniref:TPX2 C-terminal domain-containing protein n=1 Tax=Euplotes crassus TaxID=5936 RepID=A0AAD1U8E5_EUPCR|nr:unnamed protein product [Moneuplotes crassus]
MFGKRSRKQASEEFRDAQMEVDDEPTATVSANNWNKNPWLNKENEVNQVQQRLGVLNLFKSPGTTYSKLRSKERQDGNKANPSNNANGKNNSKYGHFGNSKIPKLSGPKMQFKVTNPTSRFSSFSKSSVNSSDERSNVPNFKPDRGNDLMTKINNRFNSNELRSNTKIQNSQNMFNICNEKERSDSRDSLSGPDSKFRGKFGRQSSSSQSDKENQGFRSNGLNKKIFEDPAIKSKASSKLFGFNRDSKKSGTTLERLRNDQERYLKSSNDMERVRRLEYNTADTQIPRISKSENNSFRGLSGERSHPENRFSMEAPKAFKNGFKDNNGKVSNLCSRFGKQDLRTPKFGIRVSSADAIHCKPFKLMTERRGVFKKLDLDEKKNQRFLNEDRKRIFKARDFTAREAERIVLPEPKVTQPQEINLSTERQLEKSRMYHMNHKFRVEQESKKRELEEQRKKEIEEEQIKELRKAQNFTATGIKYKRKPQLISRRTQLFSNVKRNQDRHTFGDGNPFR